MSDNITIDIIENPTNVNVGLSTTPDFFTVNAFPGGAVWGNIVGTLSAQTDLWSQLSGLSASIIPTIVNYLSTNPVEVESLNTKFEILSSGVNLFDIFITSEGESQTLSYNPTTYNLSISLGNTVNLSSISVSPNANAVFQSLSTQSITAANISVTNGVDISGSLNVNTEILSANVPLHDVLLQSISYNETAEELSIEQRNTLSLSALSYRNIEDTLDVFDTIEEFVSVFTGVIHPGYTITLRNGRVYTFAGTDKNNPNHYLEVNANPHKPIYRELVFINNTNIIDSFYLGDFKTAKYTLQIETNFNNDIYYSEINVAGSVQTSTGVACEYGQIFTNQLILGYDVNVSLNNLELILLNNHDPDPEHRYIIKGLRTNFYRI
jgi:hypothetical protein